MEDTAKEPVEKTDELKAEISGLSSQLSQTQAQLQRAIQDVLILQEKVTTITAQLAATSNIAATNNQQDDPLERLSFGPALSVRTSGASISVTKQSYLSALELYKTTSDSVMIRGPSGNAPIVLHVRGINITVGTGGSAQLDTAITLTATSYIYLKITRSSGAATLEKGTSIPNSDATYDYYPLWYIPFNSSASQISWHTIVDCRYAPYLFALKNGSNKYEALTWDDTTAGEWDRGWIKAHA